MSETHPTLRELRQYAQKKHHREIGNILARRYARPAAIYGTWLAVRLGLSAHQVTCLAMISSLAASVAIGSGDPFGFVGGVALLHLAFWLDHVDGQVARWRGAASLDGVYFDYLMHHVGGSTLGFALGFGLAIRHDQHAWTAAGFAMALGWGLLSLHNDCRYKAFFQRLKSADRSFRVDGGSGGKPRPASPPPRNLRGFLTWAAYKSCEPHVVLVGLTGLSVLAAFAPALWDACWRWSVLTMACAAPMLATSRIARAIGRGSAESEFGLWFRPLPPDTIR